MLSSKIMRMFTLGLALAAPAAMAGDSAAKLNCPAGTKQFGSAQEGLSCRKPENRGGVYIAHGPYAAYFANGQKSVEGQYVDGFKDGTWKFYDEAGKEVSKTEFRRNSYHGQRVQYFASGKPRLVEEYQAGVRHGEVKEMTEDGKVVRQARFENGKEVAAR